MDAPENPPEASSAAATPAASTPEHRDADAVRPVAVGTAMWALALIVLLTQRSRLAAHGTTWWIWSALVGLGLGLVGLWFVRRRRATYRRAGRGAG